MREVGPAFELYRASESVLARCAIFHLAHECRTEPCSRLPPDWRCLARQPAVVGACVSACPKGADSSTCLTGGRPRASKAHVLLMKTRTCENTTHGRTAYQARTDAISSPTATTQSTRQQLREIDQRHILFCACDVLCSDAIF